MQFRFNREVNSGEGPAGLGAGCRHITHANTAKTAMDERVVWGRSGNYTGWDRNEQFYQLMPEPTFCVGRTELFRNRGIGRDEAANDWHV